MVSTGKKDTELVKKLKYHVCKLASEIGDRSVFEYQKLKETEKYITKELSSYGYDVKYQEYKVSSKTAKNIIATKVGEKKQKEIVVVGAHYDSCFSPGADDNASAVAGLLELARFMSDKQTECGIKFIAFVNEEPPFFKTEQMGSRVYTRGAKARGEEIKAAIVLEMIGYYSNQPLSQRYPPFLGPFYPDKGNFIGVIGNLPSRWLVERVVSSFKKESRFLIESLATVSMVPGVDFSDNWSFWEEDYPAVMITDTAFYRNSNYHTKEDTCETLDYESMAEVVKGLRRVLLDLADSEQRGGIDIVQKPPLG